MNVVLFQSFQFIGIVSGAYFGYHNGNVYKDVIVKKYPGIKPYLYHPKSLSHDMFYNLVGSTTCFFVGYYIPFLTLPLGIDCFLKTNPKIYEKLKKLYKK